MGRGTLYLLSYYDKWKSVLGHDALMGSLGPDTFDSVRGLRYVPKIEISMRRVNQTQGSPEWLAWRATGLGGSDACHIVGKAPWNSPENLKAEKTGVSSPKVNEAMRRGVRLEPEARLKFQGLTGLRVSPACVVHDTHLWLKASLDGITEDGKTIVEIKCPTKTSGHDLALRGRYPAYYKPQLYHCLTVTGADRCLFVSYYPPAGSDELRISEVLPDPEYQGWLLEREKDFYRSLGHVTD